MLKSCALASLEHLRNKEAPRSKSHQVAIQGFKPPKPRMLLIFFILLITWTLGNLRFSALD